MATPHPAAVHIEEVIQALTYDHIERIGAVGAAIPLLQRSIADDLRRIESQLGAKGGTLLSAIAAAIDQALLAAQQAKELV